MPWPLHGCNDHRYSYFTRTFCNRCINSLKILFEATSEGCSAIVAREFKIPQRERQRQLQNLFLCFIADSKSLP